MDTNTITVLLITKDNSTVKALEINSKYIVNFRKYLFRAGIAIASAVTIFFTILGYSLMLNSDNNSLRSQVSEFNSKIELADSLKLKQKLNVIDNNLSMLDGYLKSRGIIPQQNMGGEIPQRDVSNTEKLYSLEEQSVVFSNLIRNIPVGVPNGGPISSVYGYRRNPFGGLSGEFHPGIDFKGEYGDPIYATADGVVDKCDWYGGYGNAVLLNHVFGYQTLYGHMSKVNVTPGEEIKAGDLIGFIGSTGRSTGPHVHYEIRKDGIDIDPAPYLEIN